MTSEELFSKLYDMVDDELAQIEVSSRWLCTFKPLITYCKKPKLKTSTSYFSLLKRDGNSQAESCYAELNAFDIKNDKLHNGRLYMTVNNDLDGESKYSFMLFLKEHEDDKDWKTSFAIPAFSVEILSSK